MKITGLTVGVGVVHNTGNYSSVRGDVSFTITLEDGDDPDAVVRDAQAQARRHLTVEALTGPATTPAPSPALSPAPAPKSKAKSKAKAEAAADDPAVLRARLIEMCTVSGGVKAHSAAVAWLSAHGYSKFREVPDADLPEMMTVVEGAL